MSPRDLLFMGAQRQAIFLGELGDEGNVTRRLAVAKPYRSIC